MNTKLDIKSWLILILLGFALIFGYKWYFSGPDNKDEIKALLEQNKVIQKERDSLKTARVILENDFNNLRMNDSLKASEIARLDKSISIMQEEVNRSRRDFDKIRKELEETRKKIEEFKKNPPNRTGDDLINSLKNKTK